MFSDDKIGIDPCGEPRLKLAVIRRPTHLVETKPKMAIVLVQVHFDRQEAKESGVPLTPP